MTFTCFIIFIQDLVRWLTAADIDIEYETPDPAGDYRIIVNTVRRPKSNDNHFFYIFFGKAYPDTVLLTQNFYFENLDLKAFKRLSNKIQQQYFIDLRKTVYPLGIIVDTKNYEVTLRKKLSRKI